MSGGVLSVDFLSESFQGDRTDERFWQDVGWIARTTSGESVSPDTANQLSIYWTCKRSIAEDIGKMPFALYRRMPRGREEDRGNPLFGLITLDANPTMSAATFRETLTGWALDWGNGYAEIVRDNSGVIRELWPVHPSRVTVRVQPDGSLSYEIWGRAAHGEPAMMKFSADEIFHLRGFGEDGVTGKSIARIGAESIGLSLAQQRCGAALFGNGVIGGVVLKHPQTLTDTARKHLQESIQAQEAGASRAHKTRILEEGMDASYLGIPPEAAQFLESRQFQVEEICRWFRFPPRKAFSMERAQGWSTLHETNMDYVTDALMPWDRRWRNEVRRKLLDGTDDVYAQHNFNSLMKADPDKRGNYLGKRFQAGTLTPNEWREMDDENPLETEAADQPFVQSQMVTLEAAAEQRPGQNQAGRRASDNAPPVPPSDDNPQARLAMLRPVFEDAAARVVRKEYKATERAIMRFDGDGAAMRQWGESFADEQQAYLNAAMYPILSAIADDESAFSIKARLATYRGMVHEHVARLADMRKGEPMAEPDAVSAILSLIMRGESND